ncbi:uncharacterized protein MYCFIDRAFT_205528 [Pseudocercospora fijiensis CIRAD86]|uniref:Non-structural maintenance of chromosomes element 1 homolog n=1 Tax=Pseudocercospora fijiensis (strain CIRAD86) TaxID=383855 RepID=M2ZXM0_PSEFD|nr:uncharacterized protein MYCFIDRAFT_205528 [Pseudocercospora fijiensis CIRAD86]EME76841.1 hypothetical protein MYCFIDRAFT_205528 [Pseudocercospora fijiensis CIRAD86]
MEGDADRVVYGSCQRAFLQSLLSRQALTYEEAKPIIAAIQTAATPERETLENDVTQEDFETYIQAVGDAISPFDFEIRSSIHQTTRERTYALVNTTSDALTQIATTHTPDEIAFVKRVLDVMFDENNTPRAEIMAVKSNRALKCHKPPRESSDAQPTNSGLTMSQAERLLQSLVAEGWFEFNDETSYYSLSQRALMELRTWLVDAYNEPEEDEPENEDEDNSPHPKIKFCAACKDIVTVGQRCPNLPCNARLHDHCMRNYFRAQNGREQCAVCHTAWVDAPHVGEKAAGDAGGGRRRGGTTAGRATSAGASRRSGSTAPVVNGHEVESEEGDEGEELYE